MTPSVEDWAEKVLPGPPRPAAERAIAIGDCPDGQADAVAARDEHAAVARGPVEDQAVVSLLVRILASGDRTDGGRLGRLGALDVVSHEVLIYGVCEPEQQWVIRARLPPDI
jgi:hypothetical protein